MPDAHKRILSLYAFANLNLVLIYASLDALTTELLEALWRAGSKFNYGYTSHRGLYWGLA